MQLKFKKLHPLAKLPVYATEGAAGMDLSACLSEAVVLQHLESALVPTGLSMELPEGVQAEIRGRSGLASKHAVMAFNGTLDQDYRGEVMVLVTNFGRKPFTIDPEMRIGQMIINAAVVKCRPEFVDELDETKRGALGFGSTGFFDEGDTEPNVVFDEKYVTHDYRVGEDKCELNDFDTPKGRSVSKMVQKDHTRYAPDMGDNPPSVEETMSVLLKASKGEI